MSNAQSSSDVSNPSSAKAKQEARKWWDQLAAANDNLEDFMEQMMNGLDGKQQLEQIHNIILRILVSQEQYMELLATVYDFFEKNELYMFYEVGRQRKETLSEAMGGDLYPKVVLARKKRSNRVNAINAVEKRWQLDFKEAIPKGIPSRTY